MTAPFADVPAPLVSRLAGAGLDPRKVYEDVVAAVQEDLPAEDVTSVATIDPAAVATADLVARADGVVAGLDVAELVFRVLAGPDLDIARPVADGQRVARGDVLMTVTGPVLSLLTAERTALN